MNVPGSSPESEVHGPARDIDLRRLLQFAVRRWWLVPVCIFLFLLAGLAYLWISPRIYEAVAIVEVHEPRQMIDEVASDREDFRSEEILKTIERKLKRHSLFRRVMIRPDILRHPSLLASLPASPQPSPEDELARLLGEWTTVKLESGTLLIKVSVEHPSREVAKLLADAIVNEFLEERRELQDDSSASALKFLREEETKARQKLEDSEERLHAFQKFEDAVVLKEKIELQRDLVLQLSHRYGDKHPKLVSARGSLAELHAQLRAQLEPPVVTEAPPGATASLEDEEEDLELLEDELLTLEEDGDEFGGGDLLGEEDLDEVAPPDPLAEDKRLAEELNLLKGRFNTLNREVESDRVIYEAIASRLKQTDLSQNWQLIPLRIVEPAFAPAEPGKPNKMLALGGPVVLGGGLGVCLLFVLCAVDRSVRSLDDVTRTLRLPALGAVPFSRRLRGTTRRGNSRRRTVTDLKAILRQRQKAGVIGSRPVNVAGRKSEPLVILANPMGPAAEALRTIRAELGAKESSGRPQSFLVTSSLAGEGKSFVAANLAASFAMEEKSPTLLIEANLRAPVVHTLLDVEPGPNGFIEALAGKCGWKSAVVGSGVPQLDVLLAAEAMANPAEFLSGEDVPRLLNELKQRYTRIVIDTSRVKGTADSLLLAPHVDFTVLVVRAARTPWGEAARTRDLLADMGRPPVGVILNRTTT